MSKSKMLKVVNALLLVLLMNQAVGGLVYGKISYELFVWGHKRAVFVLLTVVAVHLILNWNWVKANYFGKKG